MTVARILVPLTGGERDGHSLKTGFRAAKPFGADVKALFVQPDPAEAVAFFNEGVSGALSEELIRVSREAAEKGIKLAKDRLAEASAASAGTAHSFQQVQGNFADCVTKAACLSDLVVFGAINDGDRLGLTEAFEATLIETGRPVLANVTPLTEDYLSSIVIAWNDSIAAAHAVTASLPFLKKAARVELLAVKREETAPSLDEVSDYLSRHGVSAVQKTVDARNRPVGEVILESAAESKASLLVLGGYGHSRLREFFMGGVTKRVLARSQIPLLLVH